MNVRRVLIVASLIAVLAAWPRLGAASQGNAADQPLDLPAMTLTPADVEAIGLTGYGRFGNGEFRSLDAYIARRAEFLNKPEATVRAAFEEAGWRRGYVANLAVPVEPGNPDSPPSREAFSVVYEYADAAGAAAAYDFNRDYAGVTVGTVDVIAGTRTFADASYMTRLTVTDPATAQDGPSDQLDLTLRLGNVVASTGLIAFGDAAAFGTPAAVSPEAIAQVEAMAARLLERIEGVLAGESPGLSNQTLRLGGADAPIAFSTEGYRRLDGDDPPYYNGYQDDFPGDGNAFADVVAAYELNQGIQAPGDPYYVVRLLVFADADGAAAYVDGVRSQGLSPAGTPAEAVDDAAAIGDESWTIGYGAEFEPGHTVAGFAVYARVGEAAMMLLLEAAELPDLVAVETLAAAQAACLETGSCPPSMPVPPALIAATPTP